MVACLRSNTNLDFVRLIKGEISDDAYIIYFMDEIYDTNEKRIVCIYYLKTYEIFMEKCVMRHSKGAY